MKNFNVSGYIEEVRGKKGIKQRHLAKLIECTETNYQNKVMRNSFNINEIFILCTELYIDLDDLKITSCLDDNEIDEMIHNLLSGRLEDPIIIYNLFEKLKEFLENKVLLDSLDDNKKFRLGYGTMVMASRDANSSIRGADHFLDRIFKEQKSLDLDFVSGLIFGCFFNKCYEGRLRCCIILKYFKKVIKYLLTSYMEESVLYIMRKVTNTIKLDSEIEFIIYNPRDEIGSDKVSIDEIESSITEIVDKLTRSKLLNLEFDRLKLLLRYSFEISTSKN